MQKYTKINGLYKRYMFDLKTCPVDKWKKMRGLFIMGNYADPTFEYLNGCTWLAYVKIDGTNSKIAFFPSTGKVRVEGKDENSRDQCGQFSHLEEVAARIQPMLQEMFPPETARYTPVVDKETQKPRYYKGIYVAKKEELEAGNTYGVELEEVPIYIYGEYYGEGIQDCGKRYIKGGHSFAVFDICQQGWWLPHDKRNEICEKLNLEQVPFFGALSLNMIEQVVRLGFPTKVKGVTDPTLIEEGLVCRPEIPLFNARKERIIVKVKHTDYLKYDRARKEFTDEEFEAFNKWYKETYGD